MKLEPTLSWVNVTDHAKAKRFYGEVLGLKKVFEMEGWAEFSYAEGAPSVGLAAPRSGSGESAPAGATIVFNVEDLDQARAELARRGVKFEGDIYEVPGVVRVRLHLPHGHAPAGRGRSASGRPGAGAGEPAAIPGRIALQELGVRHRDARVPRSPAQEEALACRGATTG